MANLVKKSRLYVLEPLTPKEMGGSNYPLKSPQDVLQKQADTANLVERRVPPSAFTPAYLQKLKDYYKFYGTRHETNQPIMVKVIRETLEMV